MQIMRYYHPVQNLEQILKPAQNTLQKPNFCNSIDEKNDNGIASKGNDASEQYFSCFDYSDWNFLLLWLY